MVDRTLPDATIEAALDDMERARDAATSAMQRLRSLTALDDPSPAGAYWDDEPHAPSVPASPEPVRTMSGKGLAMLRESEGSRLKPYLDQAGIWTIGVGHVIRDGEEHLHQGITPEQEVQLLLRDVEWAEETVAGLHLPRPLKQHQFDALCSFCFNIGAGAFRGSTMVRKLRSGDYDSVPAELMRWVYYTAGGQKRVSDGLVARRRREGHLWATGDYAGLPG